MVRSITLTEDLSTETRQARKGWQDIFRVLNEKNMQPRILYPARLSFKIEGEIKSFQDRQQLKEYVTSKPALQEILRGLLKFLFKKSNGTIHKNRDYIGIMMTLNSYLLIVTLNMNGLNDPIKRLRFRLHKKSGPIYLLSTRDSFETKGHLQPENKRLENHLSFKWSSKESRGSHPYIR